MNLKHKFWIRDVEEVRRKLLELGATELPERFQRRWVFDINPNDRGQWVRLRNNGEKTTICYKEKTDKSISGTKEIEIEVDDFDKTYEIFSKLDFSFDKYYQEDKATFFYLDYIEFKIDRWPMIPPVLEVEAKSEEKVKEGLKMLGLEGKDHGHHGYVSIYKKYGLDLHDHKILRFE